MTRGRIAWMAAILALLVTIGYLGNRIFTRERQGPAGATAPGEEPEGIEFRTVTLYFGDPDSVGLVAERRDVLARPDQAGNLAGALEDLAAGPTTALVPLFPAGTRVRHVFLDGSSGTVYIEFSRELLGGPAGGLSRELMLVRSIARTLSANFPGLSRFQILVEGRAVPALGGHLDTGRPLLLSEWN